MPGFAFRPHGNQKRGTKNVTIFDNEENLMASLDAETLAMAMCTPNTRNVWKEELLKEEKRRWSKWWDVMKTNGWTWKQGNGLIDWLFIKPNSDGSVPIKKDQIHKVNVFHSFEEVWQRYLPKIKLLLMKRQVTIKMMVKAAMNQKASLAVLMNSETEIVMITFLIWTTRVIMLFLAVHLLAGLKQVRVRCWSTLFNTMV